MDRTIIIELKQRITLSNMIFSPISTHFESIEPISLNFILYFKVYLYILLVYSSSIEVNS